MGDDVAECSVQRRSSNYHLFYFHSNISNSDLAHKCINFLNVHEIIKCISVMQYSIISELLFFPPSDSFHLLKLTY